MYLLENGFGLSVCRLAARARAGFGGRSGGSRGNAARMTRSTAGARIATAAIGVAAAVMLSVLPIPEATAQTFTNVTLDSLSSSQKSNLGGTFSRSAIGTGWEPYYGRGIIQQRFRTGTGSDSGLNGFRLNSVAIYTHNKHNRQYTVQICETGSRQTPSSTCVSLDQRDITNRSSAAARIPARDVHSRSNRPILKKQQWYSIVINLAHGLNEAWQYHGFPLTYGNVDHVAGGTSTTRAGFQIANTLEYQVRHGTFNGWVGTNHALHGTVGRRDGVLSFRLDMTPVGDSPSLSRSGDGSVAEAGTVTTAEDTAYTFQPSDFGFSNDAKRELTSHVTIATLPAAGSLTVNGSAARANQIVNKTDIGNGHLVFTPAANVHGDAYASFDFRTNNGRVESSTATMTINVTAVNDAPVGAPTLTGEAEVGQTVTASTEGVSDPDGLAAPGWTYRWIRVADGVESAIAGETGSSYVLADADVGHQIKVQVSYVDDGATTETAKSAAWPSEGSIAAPAGVTATFENAPASHDGARAFTVELRFSEEPQGLSFTTVKDNLIETTNATILGARRLTPGSNLGWEIRVRPTGTSAVVLTLPVRVCTAANAICVDSRALGAAASVSIAHAAPQVTQTPLTAQFTGMPATHDGGAFTFELALSEDVRGLSYTTVGGSALSVTGGTVAGARRLVAGQNRRWEVRVTPDGLGDVSVALAATSACTASGAICTPEGKMQSSAASATVAGPGISVADASVDEGSNASLAFTVTLSHAAAQSVSVDYATSDGTATAGADYTATSGTLTFAVGDTSKSVSVPVLDDAHDENQETMTLTLSSPSPSSVKLADATATGTIRNTDAMPRAWLSRFGRAASVHVLDAVEERLQAEPSESWMQLGGHRLGGAAELDEMASRLTPERNLWEEAKVRHPAGREMTMEELLVASAFHLVSNPEQPGSSMRLSAWGRVATSGFDGLKDGTSFDGTVTTATLGVDGVWEHWLTGLAVAYSLGDGSYTMGGIDAAELESTLTSFHPYVAYTLNERVKLWGMAGYGSGSLKLTQQNSAPLDTALTLTMGAVGVRGELLSPSDSGGGFTLALRTDALWTRTESEKITGLAATTAEASRLRLILEGSRAVHFEGGGTLTPVLEVGVRRDDGDAETGSGVEVGGRLGYASAWGLSVEVSLRALVAHEARDYEEWGASGTLRFDPGRQGLGLTAALSPSWGMSSSGVGELWSRPDTRGMAAGTSLATPAGQTQAELGYGLPAFHGRGVLTPYARASLVGDVESAWHLGTRLALRESLDLSLEATQRRRQGNTPAHELALHATLPF